MYFRFCKSMNFNFKKYNCDFPSKAPQNSIFARFGSLKNIGLFSLQPVHMVFDFCHFVVLR